jgi:hypothetical protein
VVLNSDVTFLVPKCNFFSSDELGTRLAKWVGANVYSLYSSSAMNQVVIGQARAEKR